MSAGPGVWRGARWLAPPFAIFLFVIHPIMMLGRPGTSLYDPGIGWHLATGRYILDHGAIPHHDLFSYTAAGREDVSFYWLFEALSALVVQLGGLPLYAAVCGVVYATIPVLLYRRALRLGATFAPALLLAMFGYVILLSHALARPHIVTYVCFALLIDALDRYETGQVTVREIAWLPPMMLLWCNMHGGFFAGLLAGGIYTASAGVRAVAANDAALRRRALGLAVLMLAMAAATLVNPHGPRLHLTVVRYLGMRSPSYFHEFQSPDFGDGGAAVIAFEWLIFLLLVLLAQGRGRLRLTEWTLLIVFLHQALGAIRHMNLFAIVAAPIAARELSRGLDAVWPRFQDRLRRIGVEQAALRSSRLYFPAVAAGFILLAWTRALPFPETLDDLHLSRGAATFIAANRDRFSRMFNTDNLGGALIYRFWPGLRVFVDDRVPVYGDEFVIDEYLAVFRLRPNWREVLEGYGVTSAIVDSRTPCATLFRVSPEWTMVYEDELNAIFFRATSERAAIRRESAAASPPTAAPPRAAPPP